MLVLVCVVVCRYLKLVCFQVGQEFVRQGQEAASLQAGGPAVETDPAPVNLDFNLVKHFLDSHLSQAGDAGPVTNLLSSLGIKLPPPTK